MKRTTSRFAGIVLTLLCAIPAAARTTPLRGTPPEKLLSAAAGARTTVVIVGVRVDGGWRAKDARIPAKAAAQRARVAAAKERLLRTHRTARRVVDRDFKSIPYFTLEVDEHALRRLLDDDDVTSIEENSPFERTLRETTSKIGSPTVNGAGFDGSGQTIAVIDDGVESGHDFLGTRVIQDRAACFSGGGGFDSYSLCPGGGTTEFGSGTGAPCVSPYGDTCPHGTQVAGIVAGKHLTDSTLFGVAPAAKILPIQVYRLTGNGVPTKQTNAFRADIVAALDYLTEEDVRSDYDIAAVNLSIALPDPTPSTRSTCISRNSSMDAAASLLHALGTAVIAASGNRGGTTINVPACLTDVISVAATTDGDAVASYSDLPSFLDLFAPGGSVSAGQGVYTSTLNDGFVTSEGTSFASPHVAGAFAILRDYAGQATVAQMEKSLKDTGTAIQVSSTFQVPRINVTAAKNALDTTAPTTPGTFTATGSSSGSVSLSWTASTDSGVIAYYKISRRESRTANFEVIEEVETGTTHTDSATASKMYEYSIVAVDTYGNESSPTKDYAVTVSFTNDPIPQPNPAISTTVTAVDGAHIAQLREAADAWREFAIVGRIYTSYAASGDVNTNDFAATGSGLVSAVNGARSAMSLSPFTYSVSAPQYQGNIRREHVQELRNVVK